MNTLCIAIAGSLLTLCPVLGSATIAESVRKSTATNIETEVAASLETTKMEIDYCRTNLGRSFDEIDISKIGGVGAYVLVGVITDGLIAEIYEWYGDASKAADYYYKDYLVQIGKKPWKSKHNWSAPGDSTPFPIFMETLKQNQDYERMLKMYPEYYDYYFFADTNRYKGSRVEKTKILQEEAKHDAELKETYNTFMWEWNEVKKLAKTAKLKPLDPAVQNHEWFYSDKQEEILKALDYYHKYNVRFMLEKALKHKDPVVAGKAVEYLVNPVEREKKETVANEVGR